MINLLSFCLENIPKRYESTYMMDRIDSGITGALEVVVTNRRFVGNILFVNAIAKAFNKEIKITIFNARYYHTEIYKINTTLIVIGKIDIKYNITEIINPKITRTINTIEPVFKKNTRKSKIYSTIRKEVLEACSIPSRYISCLIDIFFPTKDFFIQYSKDAQLPPNYMRAIKFCEIFIYISKLRQKKTNFKAKYQCEAIYLQGFIDSLPFELTSDQQKAVHDIKKDLISSKACRRIVMGDVGCGKTMVILCSVMIAYPYKSLLMLPTTILARQIYNEAKRYLPDFIKIACVISNETIGNIQEATFVIGTQALLFLNEDFSNFALVMTDEQHRFGTNARIKLEKMAQNNTTSTNITKPHNIQFSATPIPRTMAMIDSNLVDFSMIKQMPFKKDISSIIIHDKEFPKLLEHIKNQIAQGNQVAIIYPLIENIENKDPKVSSLRARYAPLEESRAYWEKRFNKVFVTHGKDRNKEAILESFANSSGAILLSTTMIEVGISIPNLTTIVISGAERLGFATLHQLRGRVSRNGLPGYCYLYTKMENSGRLNDFCNTLSGFDIAELDLKYRSSGDLLDGKVQSGNNFSFFELQNDTDILHEASALLDSISINSTQPSLLE